MPFKFLGSMQKFEAARSVKAILGKGQAQAIPAKDLGKMLGINERAVRLAIRDLISIGCPVASSVNEPAGFFIAITREECEMYKAQLHARLREIYYRWRDFKAAYEGSVEHNIQLPLVVR